MAIQVLEGKAACTISIRVPATCLGMQEERKDVSRDLGLFKHEAVVIIKPMGKVPNQNKAEPVKITKHVQMTHVHPFPELEEDTDESKE